jgi:hypothetical protein
MVTFIGKRVVDANVPLGYQIVCTNIRDSDWVFQLSGVILAKEEVYSSNVPSLIKAREQIVKKIKFS